jgi:hypothetical protein
MSSLRFPTLTIASALVAAALWSCNKNDAPEPEQTGPQAREQSSSPMPAAGGDMMQQLRAGCPMVVEGADVAVADTDEGVALTFTTEEAGAVGDLRTRVQHMARMYGMHAGHRGMMWHHMGGQGRDRGGSGMGMGHMAGRGPMPAATTTVTEVDKGARLELRPTDAAQLEHLREHARWHQQRMETGECWMLQGQGTAPGDDQE